MLPILVALGATGALLELRRLVSRPEAELLADADVQSLRENEQRLKQVLQVRPAQSLPSAASIFVHSSFTSEAAVNDWHKRSISDSGCDLSPE